MTKSINVKTKTIDINELLQSALFEEELETMECVLPELKYTHDVEARRDLTEVLFDQQEKEEMLVKFDLLSQLIGMATTLEEVSAKVDEIYMAELECYEENMQVVYGQTKPFEKTARSLFLLYENATADANMFITPVNSARFANAANPKHFDEFRHHLRKKFYAWRNEKNESPFYISYVGNIGSQSAMNKMAMAAQETRALAVVDLKEMSKAQEVIDYAQRLKIKDTPAHLGHLVVMGTWLYVHNAFDIVFKRDERGRLVREERPMAVPAAGAFIGKMLSVPQGTYITGLEQSAILGINGVRVAYDLERIDSQHFDECGVIQIEPYGNIQGIATANKSNNYDLRKFPKVDVANYMLKDLVFFCNKKAFSKWGERYKREFKQEMEIYFNRCKKRELIEDYFIESITYDEHEEKVDIAICIQFFESADRFDIDMHGTRSQGCIEITKQQYRN